MQTNKQTHYLHHQQRIDYRKQKPHDSRIPTPRKMNTQQGAQWIPEVG